MQPTITSANNPTIKQLRKLLTSGKSRRMDNTCIAEGVHLTRSYLETEATPQRYICSVSGLENKEIILLAQELDNKDVERVVITDSLFESLSSIHASVGIMLLFTPPRSAAPEPLTRNAVLLDNIQNPGNLGTILRTAAAANVSSAYLSSGCVSPWSPKTLRAGMGAQFGLHVYEDCDLSDAIAKSTIPVFATSLDATDSIYDKDLSQPTAWLFGNEGQGVSEELLALQVEKVTIPQSSAVESLNVAAATAVCLFEQLRQQSTV